MKEVTTKGRLFKMFQCGDEPEYIFVIESGFQDTYIVVYEDAYEQCNDGICEYYSKEQLMNKFGITI